MAPKALIGNISVILNSNGGVDSYNNYYPFGMQMPGTSTTTMNLSGSADGSYKFTSKELDPTTSLYYFGVRYYSPWSGTWLSVDPLAKKYPGWGPYNYVDDDPVLIVDPNGKGGIIHDLMNLLQPLESAFGMNNPPQDVQQQEDQTTQEAQVLTAAGKAAPKLPNVGAGVGLHTGENVGAAKVDAAAYVQVNTRGNSSFNLAGSVSAAGLTLAKAKLTDPLSGSNRASVSGGLLGAGASSQGTFTVNVSPDLNVEFGRNSITYEAIIPIPVVFVDFTYTESTGN